MSLVKRNKSLLDNMPDFFNDAFGSDFFNWGMRNHSTTNTSIPAVNISETADSFRVEMAAPGMDKSDFKIELDNNVLTISSEKQNSNEVKEDERYTRREFSYQSFQRTFHLPKEVVDTEGIEARYQNGLLQLNIPKREEVKQRPPRKIEIS